MMASPHWTLSFGQVPATSPWSDEFRVNQTRFLRSWRPTRRDRFR